MLKFHTNDNKKCLDNVMWLMLNMISFILKKNVLCFTET